MIRLLQAGKYRLAETRDKTKVLILAGRGLSWHSDGKSQGELSFLRKSHTIAHNLSHGFFRLYEVKNEPGLAGQQHLELCKGKGIWQGYVLPVGLPTDDKKHVSIIPTVELISVPKGRN